MKMSIMKKIGMIVGLLILIGGAIFFWMPVPSIEFDKNKEVIEINEPYDAKSFIKKMNKYSLDDVTIDTSDVKLNQLGKYDIVYNIHDEEYKLKVEVVDTVAPTFDAKNIELELGRELTIDQIISNVKDETETKTYFKKNYDFSKAGKQDVVVVVEDQGKNKAEKTIEVNVIKDEEKPVLKGLKDYTVHVGSSINYLKGVSASDNFDPDPEISVDSSKVDLSAIGTYSVIYTVTDRSGNKNTYTKKVNVIKKAEITSQEPSGDKVVYLTFDDGPSANTAKILKILDQYNAKATFFVTGNSSKYRYLIKEAHDAGHTIGLHTYSHNYSIYKSVDTYFDDLTKVHDMVENLIGETPKYIRFPGGSSNTISKKYCKGIMSILVGEVQNRGYQYYDWNVSSGDANGNNIAKSTIVKESTSSSSKNINLLMHDTAAKDTTVEALPEIIEYYQKKGYTFKAIDDSSYTPHHKVNN